MLRLFYSPGACSLVAHVALEEAGAEFEAEVAGDRERLRGLFGEIDALLAPGPWLLGDRYSLADPYPLTFLRWARRLELDVSEHRHWTGHARRMVERPAVVRALAREGLDRAEF